MRRNKSMVIGVACGLLCAACVFLYASGIEEEAAREREKLLTQYGGEQVEVYVAKRDIPIGEALSEANVEKRLWVSELLPEKAVTNLEEAKGVGLTSPLYKGEVASMSHISAVKQEVLRVPEGLCAVSVASEPVLAVGGAIIPGQRVDMYSASGTSTDLITKDVEVLSTSAGIGEGADGADITWITVAVKADLVREVIMAAQTSELYFALPAEGSEQKEGAWKSE